MTTSIRDVGGTRTGGRGSRGRDAWLGPRRPSSRTDVRSARVGRVYLNRRPREVRESLAASLTRSSPEVRQGAA